MRQQKKAREEDRNPASPPEPPIPQLDEVLVNSERADSCHDLFLNPAYRAFRCVLRNRTNLNINFNLRNKEAEIRVYKIVGEFLESSGISIPGKLLIVKKVRPSSDHVAQQQVMKGLFLLHGNLCRII